MVSFNMCMNIINIINNGIDYEYYINLLYKFINLINMHGRKKNKI